MGNDVDLQALLKVARENCLPAYTDEMKMWTCVVPQVHWWLRSQAIADNYLEPLAAIFGHVKPARYLGIGVLWGTLESYMIKKSRWHPEVLVLCDVDAEMYNPRYRDSFAYAYRNITSPYYGNYQKHFVIVRDSSHSDQTARTLRGLAPFDLLYVDGDHEEQGAYDDICLAYELLAPGGIMLVHDIDLVEDDVMNAYARYLAEHPNLEHGELRDPDFKFGLGVIKK